MIHAIRYHDVCMGHRVYGHESKCANLHGHNYRFHFSVMGMNLDKVGRVMDFAVIKSYLCDWLEKNYDHRMLIWEEDPMLDALQKIDPTVIAVPYNPTAENIAGYFIKVVAPVLLAGTGVSLVELVLEETRKCSVKVQYYGRE